MAPTLTLVLLQVLVPGCLLWWHARTHPQTFTAWALTTTGVASYIAATAVLGNWDVMPWITPFVFLFILGAGIWHRSASIRSLPGRPHHNDEWRDVAHACSIALAGVAIALVAVATRPVTSDGGALDVATLNLYRQLTATAIGLVMLVASIRSARAGRVLLSALFIWAAGTNLRVALTNPADYLNYAPFAILDVYRAFILGFFADHIVAIVSTIAVGQACIVFLLAANGWPRRLGYVGAMVFLLAIIPLGVGAGFPATILMALAAAEVLHADRYAVFGRNVNATDEELALELPGDEFIAYPYAGLTHAVTIFKPAHEVWPWLVQMGAGRGGWYSYDRLDNGGHPSASRIVPELQAVKLGMVFPALPGVKGTFELVQFARDRSLVLAVPGPHGPVTTWAFALQEPVGGVTRLIVRARVAYKPMDLVGRISLHLMRAVHFIMERKQLNELVVRVERL